MSDRERYTPGAAAGAEVRKEGEKWTLVLVRELAHPPEKVWQALTEPEHLRQWAPYDSDWSSSMVGTATSSRSWAPKLQISETWCAGADAYQLLELNFGAGKICAGSWSR